MEYICKTCGAIFEEPESNKLIQSLLARFLVTTCPYCKSDQIELTEKSKLLFSRKQKIEKIENDNN
jgi:DNA-directed RNA polymerase subunit RPC12/RpoP